MNHAKIFYVVRADLLIIKEDYRRHTDIASRIYRLHDLPQNIGGTLLCISIGLTPRIISGVISSIPVDVELAFWLVPTPVVYRPGPVLPRK